MALVQSLNAHEMVASPRIERVNLKGLPGEVLKQKTLKANYT